MVMALAPEVLCPNSSAANQKEKEGNQGHLYTGSSPVIEMRR